ncbi:MAG: calcium-binding protein [Phycisphaerae bacterium]|nr:calcium-binding protein [Phycisphaerae bacterium]
MGPALAARRGAGLVAGALLFAVLLCGLNATTAYAQAPDPDCITNHPTEVAVTATEVFVTGTTGDDTIAIRIADANVLNDNGTPADPTDDTLDSVEGIWVDYADDQGNAWSCYVVREGIETAYVDALEGNDQVDCSEIEDESLLLDIDGGTGDDTLTGGPGNDLIVGGPPMGLDPTITDADVITGGAGDDVIFCGYDDDEARGNEGADQIDGEDGDDTLYGEDDDDLIWGGAGNDFIDAGDGDDGDPADEIPIDGGPGNDTIYGGSGSDFISGGDESPAECLLAPKNRPLDVPGVRDFFSDVIFGDADDDILRGGEGNDFISGGAGNDTINGQGGFDYVFGGPGDDDVSGGGDNDIITGGPGGDTLTGGGGEFDLLDYLRDGGGEGVTVNLPEGTANDTHGDEDTLGRFSAVRTTNNPDTITGNADSSTVVLAMAHNDTILTGRRADIIFGNEGNDTIRSCGAETDEGEAASCLDGDWVNDADLVLGGDGNDEIYGYTSLDYLFGDGDELLGYGPNAPTPFDTNGNRIPDFELGEPNPFDPTMPQNIEILGIAEIVRRVLRDPDTGEITQMVPPTSWAFAIGSDKIWGGPGTDYVVGGAGPDELYGDGSYPDPADSENSIDTSGSDYIWGDLHIPTGKPPFFPDSLAAGNDSIAGGPMLDVIYGCGGIDVIYGDFENGREVAPDTDLWYESMIWNDVIYGDFDYDYIGPDGIWDIDPVAPATLAIYDDYIFGQEGDDEIYGGAGDDYLVGGPDDDVIQGNAGIDEIYGGNDGIYFDYKDFSPRDTLDYSSASQWYHSGVVVMLGGNTEATAFRDIEGTAYDDGDPMMFGFSTGYDYIYGIENVLGSDFNDVIIGTSETLQMVQVAEALASSGAYFYEPNWVYSYKDLYAGRYANYFYYGNFVNILLGRLGNDIVMGRGGEDLVVGGLGNDIICGDTDMHCDPDGNDPDVAAIVAGRLMGLGLELKAEHAIAGGNDYLFGEWGNDKLYGDGGDDLVRGGPGADTLSGGFDVDVLDYSDFIPSVSVGSPAAVTPVVVNLRKTSVNLATFEQELADDLSVLPALPTALTPLPLAPCTNLNTVVCPDTAVDGGDPGVGFSTPPIPPTSRSLDTIINSPADSTSTPYFNESLDRLEIVLGTSGDDVIFGHKQEPGKSKPNMLIGWSGNDILVSGDSVYNPNEPNENRLPTASNPILYDNIIFGDGPGSGDPASQLAIRFLPTDLGAIEPGDDLIESGKGDDYLQGGDQTYLGKGDFLAYSHVNGPVTISLADTQPQIPGAGGSDTLLGFENLIGSRWMGSTGQGDVLIGNQSDNLIYGLNGDDILAGGPGNDTLTGGLGQDTASYECDTYAIPCVDPAEFTVSQDPDTGVYFVSNDGQDGTDMLPGIELVLGPAGPITLEADTGGTGGGTVPAPQLQIILGVQGELKVSEPGGQVELRFSASGGVPPYTAKWDPTTDIDVQNADRTVTILTYTPSSFQANQIQTAIASPVRDTSYRVTVTDSKGTVKVAFVKVKVAAAFSVLAGVDRTISLGQQLTLKPTITGGLAPYTYSWQVQGTGDGGFLTAKNIPAITVAPTETTTYVLTVTDSIGSTAVDAVVVTVLGDNGNPITPDDAGGEPTDPPDTDPGTDTDPGDTDHEDPAGDDGDQNAVDDSDSGSPLRWRLPICGAGANLTLVMAGLLMLAVMKRREW